MVYLEVEEVLIIHSLLVDATGGVHGIRDTHRIRSLLDSPRQVIANNALFQTVYEKAAAYMFICIHNHPFIDGNKRTALVLAARFLYINRIQLTATNSILENFVMKAVLQKYDIQTIARFLEKYSKKI